MFWRLPVQICVQIDGRDAVFFPASKPPEPNLSERVQRWGCLLLRYLSQSFQRGFGLAGCVIEAGSQDTILHHQIILSQFRHQATTFGC